MKTNPWGLTPREADTFDAICEHGCQKLAARALGLSTSTVQRHIWHASTKMGNPLGVRKFVQWDRWRQAQRAELVALADAVARGIHGGSK